MKKALLGLGFFILVVQLDANAQLMKKIQQKAAQAAEKVIDKKIEQQTDKLIGGKDGKDGLNGTSGNGSFGSGELGGSSPGSSANSKGRMRNTGGGGLITTPPDVKENLNSAEAAFKSQNYGASRYAIQQAILGVEMEIGNQLLKDLPATVAGLPKDAEEDQVSSSGWGWAGLHIQRVYRSEDQELTFTIANNTMLSAVNQYLASGLYSQSVQGGEQKWKQILIKGNKATIEYDDQSGYKVNVPLGQSSLMVFEGVNFKSEGDMIAAINEFDLEKIRKTLGEK